MLLLHKQHRKDTKKREILHHCTNKQNTEYFVYLQPFEFASDIYGLCVLNTPEPLRDKCLCIHYIDSHKFIINIYIKIHQQKL